MTGICRAGRFPSQPGSSDSGGQAMFQVAHDGVLMSQWNRQGPLVTTGHDLRLDHG